MSKPSLVLDHPLTVAELEAMANRSPTYKSFKMNMRRLREENGLEVVPTRQGGYWVTDPRGTLKDHLVQWNSSNEEEPLPKPIPGERKSRREKKEAKKEETRQAAMADRESALEWLKATGLPVTINPPIGSTFESVAWDLRTLAGALGPEATADDIKALMLERYQYRFPTARPENVRFLLFRDSPAGTARPIPYPLPMLGIDFDSLEASQRANTVVEGLQAQQL